MGSILEWLSVVLDGEGRLLGTQTTILLLNVRLYMRCQV